MADIILEDYTRLKKVGDGGYATVYKVRHNRLEYIRAIRVLKENVDNEDDPVYDKFIKECKVLLRLGNGNHPNIVHIYQPLLKQGKAFVEMDYITGEDIKEYIEREKFIPIEEVIRFVQEIGSALAYCHVDIYKYSYDRERDELKDDPNDGSQPLIDEKTRQKLIETYRVIHNDIHSGNIMRREDGHYILLDFGLSIQNGDVIRKSQRTNGAPEYKAPEKWDNDTEVTPQSDIYSFGIVLYEMLTGHVPFVYNKSLSQYKAESQLRENHLTKIPQPIVAEREKWFVKNRGKGYVADVPIWLVELVQKCLAKKPTDRFKDGAELYNYIKKFLTTNSILEKEILSLREEVSKISKERDELKKRIDGLINDNKTEKPNSPPKEEKKGKRRKKPWENQVNKIINEQNNTNN